MERFKSTLTNDTVFCDNIPLHLTTTIQPHGGLLVISMKDFTIIQVSENIDAWFQANPADLIGKYLPGMLEGACFDEFSHKCAAGFFNVPLPFTLKFIIDDQLKKFASLVHEKNECIIIEIEPATIDTETTEKFYDFFQQVQHMMSVVNNAGSVEEVAAIAAREIKQLSGFDKVMIYTFDEEWNGKVIAEEKEADMEPYLGLQFPATDVPKPARDLYLRNPYRLIPDREYQPVKLLPANNTLTGTLTDLSDCKLRSVMDVHLKYLANMQVMASMSTRIVHQEKLWGLIACHHKTPRYLSFKDCALFEFISGIISSKISSLLFNASIRKEKLLQSYHDDLLKMIPGSHQCEQVLIHHHTLLLKLLQADGVAICWENNINVAGQTPATIDIAGLVDWLKEQNITTLSHFQSLPAVYEKAIAFAAQGSGLLVLPVQPYEGNFILGFRAEKIQQVSWGGDPGQAVTFEKNKTYSPRNSFAIWKNTVRHTARPWGKEELDIAERFRIALVEHTLKALTRMLETKVIERTSELAASKQELEATHAELMQMIYITTHDLKEPVRKIHLYSTVMKEQMDASAPHKYMDLLMLSSNRISTLLNNLLHYSRLNQVATWEKVDLNEIIKDVIESHDIAIQEKKAKIELGHLPVISANKDQMRQVFFNLVDNALKFNQKHPVIKVDAERITTADVKSPVTDEGKYVRITVRDNGIGFHHKYADDIFKLFNRLHNADVYTGEGIGLAITKKIIQKHNGTILADGRENNGAVFTIVLPVEKIN